jgi:hypothetical protein
MEGKLMKASVLFNPSELNGVKYCSARLSSITTVNNALVPFDEMFENIGNFTLNDDGSITVPEDGTYMVFARVNKYGDEDDEGSMSITINGSTYGSRTYINTGSEISFLTPGANFQIVSLLCNDTIAYKQTHDSDFTIYGHSGETAMCQITLVKIGD